MESIFNRTFFKFTAGFVGILLLGFAGIIVVGYMDQQTRQGGEARVPVVVPSQELDPP